MEAATRERKSSERERLNSAVSRDVPKAWHTIKRTNDIVLGVAFIMLSLPVVLLACVAVIMVTRGTPLFAQERVGLGGRAFKLWKLRTMVEGAHEMREDLLHLNEASGPVFKIKNDPRLHPLGAFLRRTSIDEFPNLWNVLLGDMSLVGPRPPLPSEVEHYDAYARRRLTVKPGITCIWQAHGRSGVSFEDWMTLDNHYIDTWSPLGDLKIILQTIPAVLGKDGAH